MKIDIRDYGALSDGLTLNTRAIQDAMDACRDGDTVLIQGGVYLTGALFLKSGTQLEISSDAVLLGSRDPSCYPLLRYSFEGVEQECYASLLNTSDGPNRDIRITGGGAIDANGLMLAALEMETETVRGRAVCIRNCTGVTIRDVRILHTPAWCLHLYGCRDITISGIFVDAEYSSKGGLRAYTDNDDGIVLDSCENAVIQDCVIRCHDDCISIKSGKGEHARLHPRPSRDIQIRGCTFRLGSGVAIGSEMSGGIEDVEIRDCRFMDTFSLFCLKTARSRGGYIRRIRLRDCTLESRDPGIFSNRKHKGVVYMDASYKESSPVNVEAVPIPVVADIHISDVSIQTLAARTLYIHGLRERPFQNILLERIFSNCTAPDDIVDAEVCGDYALVT